MKTFTEWLKTKNESSDSFGGPKDEHSRRHVRVYDNGYEHGFHKGLHKGHGMPDSMAHAYSLGYEHGSKDNYAISNGSEIKKYHSHNNGGPLKIKSPEIEDFVVSKDGKRQFPAQ